MRRWIGLAAMLYPRHWRERYGEEFDALLDDATADWRQLQNVAQGAIIMQFRSQLPYLKLVGALSLAGALLAMASLYPLPPRYVSSAVLRVTPVVAAGQTTSRDVLQRETEDWIGGVNLVLSRRNLVLIVQDPTLNLYPAERERFPLEDVAEQMSDDKAIQILPVALPNRDPGTFRVSFAYPDRLKAQAVVDKLVIMLRELNESVNQEYAARWKALWSTPIPFRYTLDVTEPAAIPTRLPVLLRVALGTAAGLLLGMLVLLFWRRLRLGLRIAACGLAGCAVAGGLSLLISEQHTFTGALRMSAPFDPLHVSGNVAAQSLNDWAPKIRMEVLDSPEFPAALRDPKFGFDDATAAFLYRHRERVFGIRLLDSSSGPAGPSLEFNFGYPDKDIAKRVVLYLMSEFENHHLMDVQWMDADADEQIRVAHERQAGERLELAMNPTDNPSHRRLQLTIAGAVMGILIAVARWSGESHPATA